MGVATEKTPNKAYFLPYPVSVGENKQPTFIGAYLSQNMQVFDDLLDYCSNLKRRAGKVGNESGENNVDVKTKNCAEPTIKYDHPACQNYIAEVQEALEIYKRDYIYADHVAGYTVENWQVQEYPKGGAYHEWHTERIGNASTGKGGARHLVFMTYLNDIEDGGETEFFYQKLKVKPQKGLTLIWPVDWTHTHRGVPSMTEEKIIATGWYYFVGD